MFLKEGVCTFKVFAAQPAESAAEGHRADGATDVIIDAITKHRRNEQDSGHDLDPHGGSCATLLCHARDGGADCAGSKEQAVAR